MKNTDHMLCLGYGYTARHFADKLEAIGWNVTGSTRNSDKISEIKRGGANAIVWNGEPLRRDLLEGKTGLLISAAPTADGCPVLNAAIQTPRVLDQLKWIGYLSTNGVYGDHQGARVDETSELRGTSNRALWRIAAEKQWRAFAELRELRLHIFRLPGIYGPGRSAFDKIRNGTARRLYKPGQMFSRMHVDDIATTLCASVMQNHPEPVFNLCDDEPGPPQDVVSFACALLGVEPPPLIPIEDANISDMARSFYADNKRVCNQRMKDALGIKLRYPTYREGLPAVLEAE